MRTMGWAAIQTRPVIPMVRNQITMIGPKVPPTFAVPRMVEEGSRRVITVNQTTAGLKAEVTTARPS